MSAMVLETVSMRMNASPNDPAPNWLLAKILQAATRVHALMVMQETENNVQVGELVLSTSVLHKSLAVLGMGVNFAI